MSAKKVARGGAGRYRRVFYALLVSNGLGLLLYLGRVADTHEWRYWYLFWNLALAWLPLGLAWWLVQRLQHKPWRNAVNVILTLLWLGFLPNSFYVVSDLIHLQSTGEVSLLYDAVLFFSFIFNGFVSGFISLYIIHRELLNRLKRIDAHAVVGVIILICSFAIYLGRNLRWNTWDVLVNPAGILFDVSDRLINPIAHPQAFVTTITFTFLIGSMYAVVWQLVRALRSE